MPVARVVIGSCVVVPLLAAGLGAAIAGSQSCSDGSVVPYAIALVACLALGIGWAVRQGRGWFAASAAAGSAMLSTGGLLFAAFVVGFDRCFVF